MTPPTACVKLLTVMATRHILLVEDEAPLREAVAEQLTDRGFHVEQAASGEEAIDRLSAFAFDIVITDLRLGGGAREHGEQGSNATHVQMILRDRRAWTPAFAGVTTTSCVMRVCLSSCRRKPESVLVIAH